MSADRYEIVVAGAGPAGLAAAVAAAAQGKRVCVVDENPQAGGQIWRHAAKTGTHASVKTYLSQLQSYGTTFLAGWKIISQPGAGLLRLESRDGVLDIGYEKLIVATGARERFLPFPGWTLPNIVGVGGLQNLLKGGLPLTGKTVVIAGSGPLLLALAFYAKQQGAQVLGIFEQAPLPKLVRFGATLTRYPAKILQGLEYKLATLAIPYHAGWYPVEAIGQEQLQSITVTNGKKTRQIPCNYLACAFNLVPNSELPMLLGCRTHSGLQPSSVVVDEWQQTTVANVYCAGEPTGVGGVELALAEGSIAGYAAAGNTAAARKLFPQRKKMHTFAARLEECFALRPELKTLAQEKTTVCRCEDVTYGELKEHNSWRSAKLHTRCGMGACQGRTCGAAAEFVLGWDAPAPRPPVFPAHLSSLAAPISKPEAVASPTQENL